MLKVVLVEDETVIRESIRDNVPWEEYGYKFVGEAQDGEMALSVIRQTRPDVLITDIKMPFLDGLSLSKIVSEEFPKTKIVIISGYDDFEYARTAIEIGVEQYLLKPITKMNLKKVLTELKEKIEANQLKEDYQTQFANEMHEYERYDRRRLFEKIFLGELSVMEIYDEAGKQGIELTATAYNLLFINVIDKENKTEEMIHFFLRNPQYVLFGWNVNTLGVLIMSDSQNIEAVTKRATDMVSMCCKPYENTVKWYAALGKNVERLSQLPECYQVANHHLAMRFLQPEQHILSSKTLSDFMPEDGSDTGINNVEPQKMDPEIIKDFLDKGISSEITDFVASYITSVKDALNSNMFRDYMVLNIRFAIHAYVESLGATREEHTKLMNNQSFDFHIKPEDMEIYFIDMLQAALQIRDRESDYQSGKVLRKAMEYIDANYDRDSLSLNEVANEVNVSPNYLSAVFSQKQQITFVEYITAKRMEKAKKLLKTTEKSSGDIALEVGYKDPHYFSFVFKKTQGCSPREYRTSARA